MSDWIEEGEKAPDFTLQDDSGNKVRLSALKGKPVVLYFYPKDDTPGCTKEACAFRDRSADLKKAGAVVLGYYLAYWSGVRRRYRRHARRPLRKM